jgi:colanic acid/amylovoran biosynthesis glycosyltransferase
VREASHGKIAYLISQYPAFSHVFVEREIRALEALGWQLSLFSINPTGVPGHLHNSVTTAVKDQNRASLVGASMRFGLRYPAVTARLVATTLQKGAHRGPGVKPYVWQIFYLVQALFIWGRMKKVGVSHLHVHFANNAADVARLVVEIGRLTTGRTGPDWSWSMTVHGPTDLRHAEELDLAGKVAATAFVTCISEYGLNSVKALVDASSWDKLSIVHMGIDETPAPPRVVPPTPRAVFRVLFVGRLVPEKGVGVLVEGVARLGELLQASNSPTTVELAVVGDGPLRPEVARLTGSLPSNTTVQLLGALPASEVADWYSWADVFCLPSRAEGLPVVLMEAMASVLPVVTTPIAAIPELVHDGETGLLTEVGSAPGVAAALERLLHDPALSAALGRAGRAAVLADYLAATNAERLSRLFASVA